jgi:hypothetical protein
LPIRSIGFPAEGILADPERRLSWMDHSVQPNDRVTAFCHDA